MIEHVAESDPPSVWALMEKFSGGTAYDIGANAGQSAFALAPRFDRVFSFEPAVESLEAMAAANLPTNVHVMPMAVSSSDGPLTLTEQDRHLSRGQLTSRDPAEPTSFEDETHGWGKVIGTRLVHAITVDTIAERHGPPDFIKCDVEGHEVEVFKGAHRTLIRYAPALFVEVHSEMLGEDLWLTLEPIYKSRLGIVRHPGYPDGSLGFRNHYWLVAWPT